jgi:hypothetical protein
MPRPKGCGAARGPRGSPLGRVRIIIRLDVLIPMRATISVSIPPQHSDRLIKPRPCKKGVTLVQLSDTRADARAGTATDFGSLPFESRPGVYSRFQAALR